MNKEKQELKSLDTNGLLARVEEYKRALFSLRLNATTAHVKDYSQFKKMRKSLARALTYLRQK
jgi:large subunit ribosomal protein L29